MEALKRLRPWSLTLFAVFCVAFAVLLQESAFWSAMFYWLAIIAMWCFVVTEAFGYSKTERSWLNRWFARMALVPLTLLWIMLPPYLSVFW